MEAGWQPSEEAGVMPVGEARSELEVGSDRPCWLSSGNGAACISNCRYPSLRSFANFSKTNVPANGRLQDDDLLKKRFKT